MEPERSEKCSPKRRGEKANCAVCDDIGDGFHFGAEACRACAAFFRRTVALGKVYECRQNGYCTVNSIIRSICKSCRLNKCYQVGMKSSCVQPRRDILGKREEETFSDSVPSTVYNLPPVPSFETMPILERMRMNYEKLDNARSVIHRREGENMFEPKVPRALNFREALEMSSKEISLVADWIEWCFDDFGLLPVDQKTILFQNFFPYFQVLEHAFLTCQYGSDDRMVLASKDYVNVQQLEEFFSDSHFEVGGRKLAEIFKHTVDLQNRSLHRSIIAECVDFYEFFGLVALLFWDFGLDGQSSECNEIGRKIKLAVSREINFYLTHVKQVEEPLCRAAMIITILPSLQRVVHRFREDISLAHIFDVYTIPSNFYNVLNGRFS
ncbi:unnamed protein product [Caenorhabditis sp. 36 PRJEB53466]|nr:unnamed protein product [Caenorhabditis sp. 36 PRJEB53466]